MGIAENARPRLEPRFLGGIGGGEHDGGCAVIDAAGIARRDGAVLLEHGLEHAELLERGALGVLVGVEGDHVALHLDLDRDDLALEAAFADRRGGAGLALEREGVLLVAGDLVLGGDVLRRHTHMAGAERAGERAHHHVDGRSVAHLLAPAGGRQAVGPARHALGTAGEAEFRIAVGERLDHRDDCLGARAAEPVDVHRGGLIRHAGIDGRGTREIHVARLGVDDMAVDHVADLARLDAGALHRRLRGMGRQRDRRSASKAPAEGADRGARAVEYHDVRHGVPPPKIVAEHCAVAVQKASGQGITRRPRV